MMENRIENRCGRNNCDRSQVLLESPEKSFYIEKSINDFSGGRKVEVELRMDRTQAIHRTSSNSVGKTIREHPKSTLATTAFNLGIKVGRSRRDRRRFA
jgi:hypothetical protein